MKSWRLKLPPSHILKMVDGTSKVSIVMYPDTNTIDYFSDKPFALRFALWGKTVRLEALVDEDNELPRTN